MVKLTLSPEDHLTFIELGSFLDRIITAGELHNLTCDSCQHDPFGFDTFHKNWKVAGKCTMCGKENMQISNPHIIEFFTLQKGIDFARITENKFALFLQYRLLLDRLIRDSNGSYHNGSVRNPLSIKIGEEYIS